MSCLNPTAFYAGSHFINGYKQKEIIEKVGYLKTTSISFPNSNRLGHHTPVEHKISISKIKTKNEN